MNRLSPNMFFDIKQRSGSDCAAPRYRVAASVVAGMIGYVLAQLPDVDLKAYKLQFSCNLSV